jgi:GT2 family glycosyltransferase
MAPWMSVVIPAYNEEMTVAGTVSAARAWLEERGASYEIIVVDNASMDGTEAALDEAGLLAQPTIHYTRLPENLGGSGGFAHGMQLAFDAGSEWFWLMDDDAMAERGALAGMLAQQPQPEHVYGSSAIFTTNAGDFLCWPVDVDVDNSALPMVLRNHAVMPERAPVFTLPFLGFFIHRSLVARIGFPDTHYFVYADDVDYSARARQAGAKLYLVRSSIIHHPCSADYTFRLLGYHFFCRAFAPERRYYIVRNQCWLARRYRRRYLVTKLLPSIAIRTVAAMMREERPWGQLTATLRGLRDGFLGRLEAAQAP